jgi:hypothetical protein
MALAPRLLENNGPEIVALVSVELGVFKSVAQLGLQAGNAVGSLALFLLSPGAESRRCASVPLSLFVGDLGCSLYIHRYLDMVPLLTLDGHNLYAALARGCQGNPVAFRLHGQMPMVRIVHLRVLRASRIRSVLIGTFILAGCHRCRLTVRGKVCNRTGTA